MELEKIVRTALRGTENRGKEKVAAARFRKRENYRARKQRIPVAVEEQSNTREGRKREAEGNFVNGKLRREPAKEATGDEVGTEAFTFSPSLTLIQIQRLQVSSQNWFLSFSDFLRD